MHSRPWFAIALLTSVLGVACTSKRERAVDAPTPSPGSTGGEISYWSSESPSTAISMTLALKESDGRLSGSGSVSGVSPAPKACQATVTGTRTRDEVSLNISCPGFLPFSFHGRLTGSGLVGTLAGSGLDFTNYRFRQTSRPEPSAEKLMARVRVRVRDPATREFLVAGYEFAQPRSQGESSWASCCYATGGSDGWSAFESLRPGRYQVRFTRLSCGAAFEDLRVPVTSEFTGGAGENLDLTVDIDRSSVCGRR